MRAPPDTSAVIAQPQVDDRFQPRGLLRSAHLQSILPSLPPLRTLTRRRAAAALGRARPWLIDCGGGVRLQGFHTPAGAADRDTDRIAVLLHGWEGSADSAHVLSLSVHLARQGFDVLRLNLRDHGDTHHLNRELFHSCRLPEVVGALQTVAAQFAGARLYLAGFSLGGNFLLRAAADPGIPASVAGVVAVSPVLDPATTLLALEQSVVYRRYFVRCWSRSLRSKARAWPGCYDFEALLRSGDLRFMTTQLVGSYTSYGHLDEYLAGYAVTGKRLAALRIPAAVLLAQDDPIIPADDIRRLASSARLRVTLTRYGGHCGFLADWALPSFADNYVLEQFARFATTT